MATEGVCQLFWRRRFKVTKLVWRTGNTHIRELIRGLVAAPENNDKFGPEYLTRVAGARFELEKRVMKINVTSALLVAALFVQLFSKTTEFSILGISIKEFAELREILLVVTMTLNLISGLLTMAVNDLKVIQEVVLEVLYPDQSERKLVHATLPYQYGNHIFFEGQADKHILPTSFGMFAITTTVLSSLVALIILMLVFPAIQIAAWWQILQNPTVPEPWNTVILIVTAFGMFGSITLISYRNVRLPFKDYTLAYELNELQESDMAAYEARIKELFEQDMNR